jgi:hypothetical protein
MLPSELRWKVQSYLRTPTAELIREAADNHEKDKCDMMPGIIRATNGDVEAAERVKEMLNEFWTCQGFVQVQCETQKMNKVKK